MILVMYDIGNSRTRTRISKFLERYGRRLQYSIFEICQPDITIELIKKTIQIEYRPKIKNKDSILIVPIFPSLENQIIRIGAKVKKEKAYLTFCS
jgi:CRISPR-associated protein Cas2